MITFFWTLAPVFLHSSHLFWPWVAHILILITVMRQPLFWFTSCSLFGQQYFLLIVICTFLQLLKKSFLFLKRVLFVHPFVDFFSLYICKVSLHPHFNVLLVSPLTDLRQWSLHLFINTTKSSIIIIKVLKAIYSSLQRVVQYVKLTCNIHIYYINNILLYLPKLTCHNDVLSLCKASFLSLTSTFS